MIRKSFLKKLGFIVLFTLVLSAYQSAEGGYQEGLDAFDREDYSTAIVEWLPLANQGNSDAQNGLGVMYENGIGLPKDYKKAIYWYRKAGTQGINHAMITLGMMYENGLGTSKDYKEAMRWWRKSAEHGYSGSMTHMGIMYLDGKGDLSDFVQAYMWFVLAIVSGDKDANTTRSLMKKLMTPQQIEKAKRLAREWLEKHRKK